MKSNSFTLSESQSRELIGLLSLPKTFNSPAYPSTRNAVMALLMLDAGLRVGEMTHLSIDDIMAACGASRTLVVRGAITKTNITREIPLTPSLHNKLTTHLGFWSKKYNIDFCPWAFPGPDALHPITTRQVRRIIGQTAQQLFGINIHPHQLRHTFATRLMKHTNIRIVQKLLGHKCLNSTQIYTHPSTEDCRNAIESIEPKRGNCRPH